MELRLFVCVSTDWADSIFSRNAKNLPAMDDGGIHICIPTNTKGKYATRRTTSFWAKFVQGQRTRLNFDRLCEVEPRRYTACLLFLLSGSVGQPFLNTYEQNSPTITISRTFWGEPHGNASYPRCLIIVSSVQPYAAVLIYICRDCVLWPVLRYCSGPEVQDRIFFFRTVCFAAVPFLGQTTQNLTVSPPKGDCSSQRVCYLLPGTLVQYTALLWGHAK